MIKINTNIRVVSASLIKKIETLRNPKPLLREVAFDVLAMMDERIHEDGKAADGSQIGEYNSNYLRLRQKKYKLSGNKKIIVVLTRELRQNWGVIATTGGWGIGFTNPNNAQKLAWVEEQKNKKIGALTKSEREYAIDKLKKLVDRELNN